MLGSIGAMFSPSDRSFERRVETAFCFAFGSKLLNGTEADMLPKNLRFSEISELGFAMIRINRAKYD